MRIYHRPRRWPLPAHEDEGKREFLEQFAHLTTFEKEQLRAEFQFASNRQRARQREVAAQLRWIQEEWFSG